MLAALPLLRFWRQTTVVYFGFSVGSPLKIWHARCSRPAVKSDKYFFLHMIVVSLSFGNLCLPVIFLRTHVRDSEDKECIQIKLKTSAT